MQKTPKILILGFCLLVLFISYYFYTRKDLTPFLAQLYVFPQSRCNGVGTTLIDAAVKEAKKLSWHKLYLYYSGTLPQFYEKLGWHRIEEEAYREKTRIIMELDL